MSVSVKDVAATLLRYTKIITVIMRNLKTTTQCIIRLSQMGHSDLVRIMSVIAVQLF
jgi:hypothetical protein